jgi:internalin A
MNTKNLSLFVTSLALLALAPQAPAQTVTFPDPNLEALIRSPRGLNQPSGVITVAAMLTLTNLEANSADIHDTTGLETAHNLATLDFSGNPVTNFFGFTGLTNLDRLTWVWGPLSNLDFVVNFPRLRTLTIYGDQFQSIAPVLSLTQLEYLQLDWNSAVTNLQLVAGLTNLTYLGVAGDGVTDARLFTNLTRLEGLGLYDNSIHDISPLLPLTSLTSLSIGWNGVTNPALLAQMPQMRYLALNGNSLTNVPFLAGLTNLIDLSLDYTALVDMSPLTNLTRLTSVNVGENLLTGYPNLASLTNLGILMTAGNQITDLSPLTNLPALGQLHLQRNLFHDVAPLTNCPNLGVLLLSGNTVTNLPVLAALSNLGVLELQVMGFTNLAPVAPLAVLPSLWQLDLYGNRLTDLLALTNFPSLGWLSVERNRLQQIQPLPDIPSLWYANLKNNALDTNSTSAAWNVITNLQARGTTVEYDPQLPLPTPLQIVYSPANRSAFPGDNVSFNVSVTGGTPAPGYRWQKDGVDLANDGRISGADSDTLHIDTVGAGDTGFYRCRVYDDWMETNSTAAELLVITNVAFADPNLEQAVRDRLGIPSAPLTPADLAAMDWLDASYRNITNLAGLEAAANLTALTLSGNPAIAGFAPVTFLSGLTDLAVSDCALDDLSWLASLRSLTSLELDGNFLQDISPLRNLQALDVLWLNENHVTEIAPLLDLSSLGEVHLSLNHLDTNSTSAAWNVITNLVARGVLVEYAPQRLPAATPVITAQPVSVAAYPGDNINFSVTATGSGGDLSYRWLKNGVGLEDSARFHNTGGDTLFIDNLQPGDAGSYRVRVWNDLGVTNSRTVTLRVVTSVAFVDPNLERAVRDRLGIPTDPLTLANLASMDWLDAHNYGITNLSGLESAANLNWFWLDENPGITDFSPVTELPRLEYLYIRACSVSNLAFLAALPPLRELDLGSNPLTDISRLSAQTQLHRLSLDRCGDIASFTILNDLTALENLFLGGTGISNITFVAQQPSLRELDLWGDAVSDLSPLATSTNLVRLELNGNHATNAAPLFACTNLEWLSFGGNHFGQLSFITNFPRLWFLAANETDLHDLSPLSGRTNITWLDVGWNPIADCSPIGTLTGLTELHIWNLGLSNHPSFLATLTNLQVFNAGMNAFVTLPPDPNLLRLRYLNLEWNPLANLNFVGGMTNLTELVINWTGVKNLSPLAGRTNLHNLALAGNGITDVSPLATLPFLAWVTLWDNHLQNISAFSGLTNLAYVDFRHNWLNINPGSAAMTVISTLQSRGTSVDYDPQDAPPANVVLSEPVWLGGNQFRFTITSAPDTVLQIWRSTDLATWAFAGWATNSTGTTTFTDTAATPRHSSYRAQQQ